MEHQIEWNGESTSVSPAFRRQGGSTGAWGLGGDVIVDHGYHCTRCGVEGQTLDEFNHRPCRPVKD